MPVHFQPRFNTFSRPQTTKLNFGNREDDERRAENRATMGLGDQLEVPATAAELEVVRNKPLEVVTGDGAAAIRRALEEQRR